MFKLVWLSRRLSLSNKRMFNNSSKWKYICSNRVLINFITATLATNFSMDSNRINSSWFIKAILWGLSNHLALSSYLFLANNVDTRIASQVQAICSRLKPMTDISIIKIASHSEIATITVWTQTENSQEECRAPKPFSKFPRRAPLQFLKIPSNPGQVINQQPPSNIVNKRDLKLWAILDSNKLNSKCKTRTLNS